MLPIPLQIRIFTIFELSFLLIKNYRMNLSPPLLQPTFETVATCLHLHAFKTLLHMCDFIFVHFKLTYILFIVKTNIDACIIVLFTLQVSVIRYDKHLLKLYFILHVINEIKRSCKLNSVPVDFLFWDVC